MYDILLIDFNLSGGTSLELLFKLLQVVRQQPTASNTACKRVEYIERRLLSSWN